MPDETFPPRLRPAIVTRPPSEVTLLSPEDEASFQVWAARNGVRDADSPLSRYDYRGAWQANQQSAVSAVDGEPHWPDTFKRHGHPTFSVESQYSTGPRDGGRWAGDDGETFVRGLPRAAERDALASTVMQMLARRGKVR